MLNLHGKWQWGWIYSKTLYKQANKLISEFMRRLHSNCNQEVIDPVVFWNDLLPGFCNRPWQPGSSFPFNVTFSKMAFHLSEMKEFSIMYHLVFSISQIFFLLIHYRHILGLVSHYWSLFNVHLYMLLYPFHTPSAQVFTFLQHQFYPLSADPPGTGASWELPCCWLRDHQEVEDDQDLMNQSEPRISTDPSCSQHLPVENTDKTKPDINYEIYKIILTFKSEVRKHLNA